MPLRRNRFAPFIAAIRLPLVAKGLGGRSLRHIAAELVLTCSYESCALESSPLASSTVMDSFG
jgi:hypothetical protein